MPSNSINNDFAKTLLNSNNKRSCKNCKGKIVVPRDVIRFYQLCTFSRKQKVQVIPSNSFRNDFAKTTSTKPLCFHLMPSNSVNNDLAKTTRRKLWFQEIPSIKPLQSRYRMKHKIFLLFKWCHQILSPTISRKQQVKKLFVLVFTWYYHILILNNN